MKKIILIFTLLCSLSGFSQGYLPSKSFNKKGDFYERTRSLAPESKSLLSTPHIHISRLVVRV